MLTNDFQPKLNELFKKRFTKMFAAINSSIYPAEKTQDGNFNVPAITILGRGGTAWTGNSNAVLKLNPPARVNLEYKKFKPFSLVYRIAIPISELEIAVKNEQYFNYLMDRVVKAGLSNYRATVGDENQVRFGSFYCTFEPPTGEVFMDSGDGEHLELRLRGEWASEEEV